MGQDPQQAKLFAPPVDVCGAVGDTLSMGNPSAGRFLRTKCIVYPAFGGGGDDFVGDRTKRQSLGVDFRYRGDLPVGGIFTDRLRLLWRTDDFGIFRFPRKFPQTSAGDDGVDHRVCAVGANVGGRDRGLGGVASTISIQWTTRAGDEIFFLRVLSGALATASRSRTMVIFIKKAEKDGEPRTPFRLIFLLRTWVKGVGRSVDGNGKGITVDLVCVHGKIGLCGKTG